MAESRSVLICSTLVVGNEKVRSFPKLPSTSRALVQLQIPSRRLLHLKNFKFRTLLPLTFRNYFPFLNSLNMIDSYLPFIFAHILLFIGLVYTSPASRLRLPLVFLIFMCCVVSVRSTFSLGIPGQAGGQYVFGMMMYVLFSRDFCLG